jgi:hypothetical protein
MGFSNIDHPPRIAIFISILRSLNLRRNDNAVRSLNITIGALRRPYQLISLQPQSGATR